jgi:hypothetical protein
MEFWESAILIVGGVWLVSYMSNRTVVNNLPTVSGSNTAYNPVSGISNQNNLTTATNMAGGQPTVIGEPLQPGQPPISPYGGNVPTALPPGSTIQGTVHNTLARRILPPGAYGVVPTKISNPVRGTLLI